MTSDNSKYGFIHDALAKRKQQHRYRELAIYHPENEVILSKEGQEYINFSGNDYLGLSQHPKVIERAQQYTEQYGAGSTASRLINGTYDIHDRLEKKIASVFGWPTALLFNSGFQANSTIISTFADRHALILADKLSHNSLMQGALASRATLRRFKHNSISDLSDQLAKADSEPFSRVIVITESLFSMDGDRSDLEQIAQLCTKHKALLFVDDAHAVGVWGKQGLGLTHGVEGIDMVLATCGKAFGSFGAFLLCSGPIRKYLINFCPGFIYTTALPPSVIGATDGALDLLPDMTLERKRLHRYIERMKNGIEEAGFETGDSDSQIIPIMVGKEEEALALAENLQEKGFLATAIRPPTVPRGSARIRITLSAEHNRQHITEFLTVLNGWTNG